MIEILPATTQHAIAMFPRLRAGDRREIELVAKDEAAELPLLVEGVARSAEASTALVDGMVAAMWGVFAMNVLASSGNAWLMTTPLVEKHRKAFLRTCRAEVASMRTRWSPLCGYVDPAYPQALRLLRWLGFDVLPQRPQGPMAIFTSEAV